MAAQFTYEGQQYNRQRPNCPGACTSESVSAWRGYATQAMAALYRMSLQGDNAQQADLQTRYCEIVDVYYAGAMATDADPKATFVDRAWAWAVVAGQAIGQLEKYGAQSSFTNPTFQTMPQTLVPGACRAGKIPTDDSWIGPDSILGEAAKTLDDVMTGGGQLITRIDAILGRFESIVPWLVGAYALSTVGSVARVFGGGRR